MSGRRPFLALPEAVPVPGTDDGLCFYSDVVEMRSKYEARIAELEGRIESQDKQVRRLQTGQEIESDYITETEALQAAEVFDLKDRIVELEARIRGLTEWRPIETAPHGWAMVLPKLGGHPFTLLRQRNGSWAHGWSAKELAGWLPLPEVTP